jgi:hypothetical protein
VGVSFAVTAGPSCNNKKRAGIYNFGFAILIQVAVLSSGI